MSDRCRSRLAWSEPGVHGAGDGNLPAPGCRDGHGGDTGRGGTMARSVGIATASSDVPAGRLRELGGVSVPADLFRTVGVDGTVVLARAMPSDDADVLREIATQHRWRLVDVADPDAASWATNIQQTSLVLVVGPDPAFTLGVLKAIRRSTSAPAVAVGLSNSGNRV